MAGQHRDRKGMMRNLSSSKQQEDAEVDTNDLWACRTIRLPTRDFENQIWGEEGVPRAVAAPKYNGRNDAISSTAQEGGLAPSSPVPLRRKVSLDTGAATKNEEEQEAPEIRLTNYCWKRRSGMGKFSVIHPWEKRRLVLVGTKVLYFSLSAQEEEEFSAGTEEEGDASLSTVTSTSCPSWLEHAVANLDQETQSINNTTTSPRGVIDLSQEGTYVEASEGNFSCPTLFEIDLRTKTSGWKLCFESQSVQIEWLAALSDVIQSNYTDDKEHCFEPGDHVIRWEMLPIVYPIQIHGIVLEAGRNCVIIADFGLTSYGKASSPKEEDEEEEDPKEESHDFVMGAWKKIRPNSKESKQRLNVIALTEPKEIRQWSKINYGRNVFSSAKGGKLKSWFQNKAVSNLSESAFEFNEENAAKELEEAMQYIESYCKEENGVGGGEQDDDDEVQEEEKKDGEGHQLLDPEWFRENEEQSQEDAESPPPPSQLDVARPPVFALLNHDDDKQNQKLPKSDPTKIVLARTNFLLEYGEEVLPPYHVFHSNSECIAVWCKTGRWSTLQTAVFLHSTAIGNAKSATAITLGVAAAHVVLIPALAVGGLAMVSAPWLILKKSKKKWEEATMQLTDLFWAWAEPEVFVEAIEHWSGLCETE